MADSLAHLVFKRTRGFPWPQDSWGLTPMFGADGWCPACAVPRHAQSGSIVLGRKGLPAPSGAWTPNWQLDVLCLDAELGARVGERFDVELREVAWHGAAPGAAVQLVVPTVGPAWFDPEELRAAVVARHGGDGATCPACGVWRWLPLVPGLLPPLRRRAELAGLAAAASPEWFGDGWKAFRQVVLARELAELIAAASPKDFAVRPVG